MKPTSIPPVPGFVLLLALLPAGCNQSETGAEGNIRFTPTNCGRASGCAFGDGIAAGARVDVTIDGIDGFPTAGVDLVSDDTTVFDVSPTNDIGQEPAWTIDATGDGITRLVAVDGDGNDVDFIEVDVRLAETLTLDNTLGNAVGPQDGGSDADELWTVQAGDTAVFYVQPVDSVGVHMMGRYTFSVLLDDGIADNLGGDAPETGRLEWNVPFASGTDYLATFDNGDLILDVLFEVP